MTLKLNRRDADFAKLVADERQAPGKSYAQSRGREYKGFNDDHAAKNMLKNEQIREAVAIHKSHIIAEGVSGRQEVLIDLTRRLRAPNAAQIMFALREIESTRMEPEIKAAKIRELDTSAIKSIKRTKHGWQVEGLDKSNLAVKILQLSGVDLSKPITDEGKTFIRDTLRALYSEQQKDGENGTE